MEWTKVSIETTTSGMEIITAFLVDMGIYNVEINDPSGMDAFLAENPSTWDYVDENLLIKSQVNGEPAIASVTFYIGTDTESAVLLQRIKKNISTLTIGEDQEILGTLTLSTEIVDDRDWLHQWKKYFEPIEIGKILIVPEWDDTSYSNDIIFRIDPGTAFGTGQHASTRMCIDAMQRHLPFNKEVLDIGCGSGILSIISLLLGATHVYACDIDPTAVEVTRMNACLNSIDPSKLEVVAGDIITNEILQNKLFSGRTYGLITANIVADVIIALTRFIPAALAQQGKFIASGIIDERLDDVISTLANNGLAVVDIITLDGWCCVVAAVNEIATTHTTS